MADVDVLSAGISATGVLVSGVGVAYQVIDIRRRSSTAHPAQPPIHGIDVMPDTASRVGPVDMPQGPVLPADPAFAAGPSAAGGAWPVPAGPSVVGASEAVPPPMPSRPGDPQVPPGSPVPVPRAVSWVRLVLATLTACLAPLLLINKMSTNIETVADPDPAWVHVFTALVFMVPFVLAYTLLSVFIGAGRPWARVATMIVLGFQLTCCGLTSVYFALQDPLQSEFVRDGEMLLANPSSLDLVAMSILSAVIAILSLLAMIMLTRPQSSAFFRDSEHRRNRPRG